MAALLDDGETMSSQLGRPTSRQAPLGLTPASLQARLSACGLQPFGPFDMPLPASLRGPLALQSWFVFHEGQAVFAVVDVAPDVIRWAVLSPMTVALEGAQVRFSAPAPATDFVHYLAALQCELAP